MNSPPNQSNPNCDRICCYPYRTLPRYLTVRVALFSVTLLGFIFIFIALSQADYYPHFSGKIKPFRTHPKNLNQTYQTSPHSPMSTHDLELYNTLQDRAKNRTNRYYLNDFEYFRMIVNEFPQTESAAKAGHFGNLMPLLSTLLDPKDVLFIIMGSLKYVHKAMIIKETWLQWSEGNFFIFADVDNASIPLKTLPQLKNKPSREDAQHRQLIGSQWLINNRSELIKKVKWFVFADDDTWINVPALLSYLQLFDYRMKLSIGYIWDDIWITGWSYFSGGAGIVLSQSAFMSVMPAIYTKECPFKDWNDLTLMHCQKQKGITKIHSDRFFWNNIPDMNSFHRLMPVYYVSKVTFHYVNDGIVAKRMTCDVAVYWKWPIKGCGNVTRDEMPDLRIS